MVASAFLCIPRAPSRPTQVLSRTKPRSHEGEALFLLHKKRTSQSSCLHARQYHVRVTRTQATTAASAHNVTHASQEASEGEDLRSKATPSPSWLRDFVRDIPQAESAFLLRRKAAPAASTIHQNLLIRVPLSRSNLAVPVGVPTSNHTPTEVRPKAPRPLTTNLPTSDLFIPI